MQAVRFWPLPAALGLLLAGAAVAGGAGTGAAARAAQAKRASAAGFLLTAAELNTPPPSDNAAPHWAEFVKALGERPLGDAVQERILAPGAAGNSDTLREITGLLAERADLAGPLNQAASRAGCAFPRDWSRTGLTLPEPPALRVGALLLRGQAYTLAAERRHPEAAALLDRAFTVAAHAGSDPGPAGYRAGLAAWMVAAGGVETLLRQYGTEPAVPGLYAALLLRREPPADWAAAARAEPALREAALRSGRVGRAAAAADTFAHAEAEWLRELQAVVALAGRPLPEQLAAVRRRESDLSLPARPDGRDVLTRRYLPDVLALPPATCAALARHRLLLNATALLTYRNARGSFPNSLEGARPPRPEDPYTGQVLRYRRESGGFLLFSRGPTGLFDGGVETRPVPAGESVFRYRGP
jgi:hypothetical protein